MNEILKKFPKNTLTEQNYTINVPANSGVKSKIEKLLAINPKAIDFLKTHRKQLDELSKEVHIECYLPNKYLADNVNYEIDKFYLFIPSSKKQLIQELAQSAHKADDFIQIINRTFKINTAPNAKKTENDFRENMFFLTEEIFQIISSILQTNQSKEPQDKTTEPVQNISSIDSPKM